MAWQQCDPRRPKERVSPAKRYFHLIPEAEWESMKAAGRTWGWVARRFREPDWCSYPNAVDPMGCWSLVGRMVTGEDYCKNCDLYRPRP